MEAKEFFERLGKITTEFRLSIDRPDYADNDGMGFCYSDLCELLDDYDSN